MEKELKNCKSCNEPILEGRSDKIYCDEYCRFDYHNKNGLRNRVYQFYFEYKEQFLIYIETEITALISKSDHYRRVITEADTDNNFCSYENYELYKLSKDLPKLEKMKKLILNDLAMIKKD